MATHLTAALISLLITISLFHKSSTHNFQPPVTLNLVWYGNFTPTQRTIILDFLHSLKQSKDQPLPSVASWWNTIENYRNGSSETLLGTQILDENYSLGKNLTNDHIQHLAINVSQPNSINIVFTAKEVHVEGFCIDKCAGHRKTATNPQVAYVWVGNSETRCPGQCAWPFHEAVYGPRFPPLVSPNGDVGVDGMVIQLGKMLANAVTNYPFGLWFYEGQWKPLWAGTACHGIFGPGSYQGYAGDVLVDKMTGASYNANGINGRKYLLQEIWDSKNFGCFVSGYLCKG